MTDDGAHISDDGAHMSDDGAHMSDDGAHMSDDGAHMTDDGAHMTVRSTCHECFLCVIFSSIDASVSYCETENELET